MTVITFTALERALGGTEPIATGRVTVDYLSGRYTQYVAVDGDEVTFPNQIGVPIVDGALTATLDVPGTGAVCCARIEIAADGARASLERFVTIPDSGTVDFGDLVDVDPDLFTPIDPTPNLVETIDDRIDLKLGDWDGEAPVTKVNDQTGNVVLSASDVGAIAASAKGAPSGVASLDSGGKLPTSQLPPLAVAEFLGAPANETAMLALVGQKGDWAVRTDTGLTWVIVGDTPSDIGSWHALGYPSAPVQTVAGRAGAVVLAKTDVGLGNVDNTSDSAKPVSTAQQAALDAKAPKDGPVFTGDVKVPTPDPDGDPDLAANIEFTQGLIDTLNAALSAVIKTALIVIPYDPVTGWPNRADFVPAWAAGIHVLWDSFPYTLAADNTPSTIQNGDDLRRKRVAA